MNLSDGRERLPVSAVKQYAYCKRRFALMFIDGEWAANYKITEGNIFHEKVNDPFFNEKRGDRYLSRNIPVFSDRLNLYGIMDIVEFLRDDEGVGIGVKPGLWRINPIEYKNGKPEIIRSPPPNPRIFNAFSKTTNYKMTTSVPHTLFFSSFALDFVSCFCSCIPPAPVPVVASVLHPSPAFFRQVPRPSP